MRKGLTTLTVSAWLLLLLTPVTSSAWNLTGHRTTALIAYRQLDEATRQKVAALLRKNPTASDLWDERRINSETDMAADAFLNAATFPDDVRPPSWFSKEFHKPTHHYVTFRYKPGDAQDPIGDPPADDDNILTSYKENLAMVKADGGSDADKEVALCWIFHQVGDIHMPLHAVSRFSNTFPNGDRGGNSVRPFPNPRSVDPTNPKAWDRNLHAYWDDLLGSDKRVDQFDELNEVVEVVLSEFPRSKFTDAELKERDMGAWAKESLAAAIKVAYRDLDPDLRGFDDLPVVYEADAQQLGRRRIALAGYRLAMVLEDLFGPPETD